MRRLSEITTLSVFFAIILLNGCSSTGEIAFVPPTKSAANGCSRPRLVEAEFLITIDSVDIPPPDSLKRWNAANGIDSNQVPAFRLWCSDIIDHPQQRVIEDKITGTKPTEVFDEGENGNRILYWDLSEVLSAKTPLTIRRRFTYTTYDYAPKIDVMAADGEYASAPPGLVDFYTRPEPSLEQTPEIARIAYTITKGAGTPFERAKAIFDWVRAKMRYTYPPDARGVLAAVKTYDGDCGQYSVLFITLCRCAGIPARQQSGFALAGAEFGFHVWSEIYLPHSGWVPMDTTIPDGFGHLPNDRLIASVGMNIPLRHVPRWATYENADAQCGRTDFMQFATMARCGFTARVTTDIRLIQCRDLPVRQEAGGTSEH